MGYDSFGRLRVSEPFTIFDSKLLFDKLALYFGDVEYSGGGTSSTYSANLPLVVLGVSANTAGVRLRQTFQYFNYQPGLSQLICMTVIPVENTMTGIIKRWGYFDDNNGVFFEYNSVGLYAVVRSKTSGSVVDTKHLLSPQFSMNKNTLWFIQFGWLGVADVVFGTVLDNDYSPLTTFHFDDDTSVLPYMSTPNLPLRYEIRNDGTGGAATMKCICATVISQGGQQITGQYRYITRGTTSITTANDSLIYPLIAIRLKAGRQGAQVMIHSVHLICTSTATVEWMLYINPTLTGTALTYTDVDTTNSSVEACLTSTNATKVTEGSGTVIDGGLFISTNESSVSFEVPPKIRLGYGITSLLTPDVIVFAARRLTGTTETFYAGLHFLEG